MCIDVVRASAIHVGPIKHSERQAVPHSTADAVVGVLGSALKKGHYYTFEVEALGELNGALSRSPRSFDRMDFRAVD